MAASIAALSSPQAWEAARQAAHQDVRAFDLAAVAETWLRLIRGGSAGDGRGPRTSCKAPPAVNRGRSRCRKHCLNRCFSLGRIG